MTGNHSSSSRVCFPHPHPHLSSPVAEEERLRAEFRASQRNTAAVAGLLRLPPPSEKFEHLAHLLTVPLTSGADAGGAASRSGSNVKAMKNPGSNPAAAGKASRPASALATTSSKAASKFKEKQPWTMTGTAMHTCLT
ncbi:hypothetical protein EON66_05530 [archaeon]|nr:MAG: hypothetical protein EON66_05530 [archaeon]